VVAPAGDGAFSTTGEVIRGHVLNGGDTTKVSAKDTAELIAEAVLAVPEVAGLHGGAFGTVATYLPGRRVTGVALRPGTGTLMGQESVEISVVAAAAGGLSTDLLALAAQVRAAVAPWVSGPVDVSIADLST